MDKIAVSIIQPHKTKVKGEFFHVIVPGVEGDFGIAPDHTPMITKIRPGLLYLYHDKSKAEKYAIHDGFVTVENNSVSIVCDIVECEDEIDIERAKRAKERAEKRMQSDKEDIDFRRADSALKRALTRISVRTAE